MKVILFFLVAILSVAVSAKTSGKSVPSSATQFIFETLVQSTGENLKAIKAPRGIEAKNLECNRGSTRQSKFHCKGIFLVENKEVEKSIAGDNDKFFEYLEAKSAIALDEARIGRTYYRANKISCSYSLEGGAYYKCLSEVSIKF